MLDVWPLNSILPIKKFCEHGLVAWIREYRPVYPAIDHAAELSPNQWRNSILLREAVPVPQYVRYSA